MSYREILSSIGAQKIRSPQPAGEINWKPSHTFCASLADHIEKNGANDLPSNFLSVIEPFVNSILECAVSDRTTLSKDACRLTGDLPKVLGRDMHPLLDRILPVMIRHCGTRKTVNQVTADAAISNIVTYSTYSPRLLYHVCYAFEEKNTPARLYATGWMKLILKDYHRSLHPDRDFLNISHAVMLALEDADSAVRTASRSLFWEYNKVDPTGADTIMSKLNSHAQTALQKDPANPDNKSAKTSSKETSRPESALAEARKQAKKRMKEQMAEKQRHLSPSVAGTSDLMNHNVADERPETTARQPKVVRDPAKVLSTQHDGQHMSKSATRPTSVQVHRKGQSHDGPIQQLTKKVSSLEIGDQGGPRKLASVDNLRTSQNKKPGSVAEGPNSRGLMSAPVRRPRVVATPINVPLPTSRPSSRTGRPQTPATASETSSRSTKEATGLSQPESRSFHESQASADVMRPLKSSRKLPRVGNSSPVIIPDGKENADAFPSKKLDRNQSPIKYEQTYLRQQEPPLELPTASPEYDVRPMSRDTDISNTPLSQSQPATATTDTNVKEARRAVAKAIDLLRRDAMDYMGFRKLRKLVSQFGGDLIPDQSHYDALFTEMLPRLGSMEQLVEQDDPSSDGKHLVYIRQAILHMISTLVSQYPPEWAHQFLGPSLAAVMIIRCTYSSDTARNSPQKSPSGYSASRNSTIDLLDETSELIVETSADPLDQLDTIVDVLHNGEDFLMNSTATYATDTTGGRSPSSPVAQLPPTNQLPSRIPYLMETGLKIITRILRKARVYNLHLKPEQEESLAELSQHLLDTYNSLIRHQVMLFCREFYKIVHSDEVFWGYFPRESDRNLIHYHIEGLRR